MLRPQQFRSAVLFGMFVAKLTYSWHLTSDVGFAYRGLAGVGWVTVQS